jgi:radical SAM superfamily enzyme YgiQ (UPF0313 family)
MSGVRVRDPELMAIGLTLPGFVERSRVIASLPSLGLLTLAAYVPEGWEACYTELDQVELSEVDRLADAGFDLIAISSLTARINAAYRVADRLRAAGQTVVLGGLHVSALPGEAAAHADAVVVGEGEAVFALLLDDHRAGRLRPVYRASDSRGWGGDDCWRVPRYDLLDIGRYNRLTLQTTRGCPRACDFCAASRLISPYRTKPISQLRRELEAILEIWPRPFIELADDNTFLDPEWSRALVALLAEYPVRWFTETDLSVADDPALLDLLAGSGCAQLLIGLESASPRVLAGVDPAGWKAARFPHCLEQVRRIQSHGISVNGCFVLGFDDDDPGVFDRTLAFIDAAELSEVQITLLTAFPGTALYRRLRREGRLLRDEFWDACTLFDPTFRPGRMSVEALTGGFRELMQAIYSEARTARRRERLRRCLRARSARRVG